MATQDPTNGNPHDNPLIEAADVLVSDQPELNAVRVEIVDQGGKGFVALIDPVQTALLIDKLLAALALLQNWKPGAGPLSSTF